MSSEPIADHPAQKKHDEEEQKEQQHVDEEDKEEQHHRDEEGEEHQENDHSDDDDDGPKPEPAFDPDDLEAFMMADESDPALLEALGGIDEILKTVDADTERGISSDSIDERVRKWGENRSCIKRDNEAFSPEAWGGGFFKRIFDERYNVIRDGKESVMSFDELVVGDLVNLHVEEEEHEHHEDDDGDDEKPKKPTRMFLIPADMIVVSGVVHQDHNMMTGTSGIFERRRGESLCSGTMCFMAEPGARAVVLTVGIDSQLGYFLNGGFDEDEDGSEGGGGGGDGEGGWCC